MADTSNMKFWVTIFKKKENTLENLYNKAKISKKEDFKKYKEHKKKI